jgi:hypothetical protein
MLVWIAYAISVCALQAAYLLGSVLQLQHGTWGIVPGDCGHQLHQFLHPEQDLPLN